MIKELLLLLLLLLLLPPRHPETRERERDVYY
jgi:hypothetical protein